MDDHKGEHPAGDKGQMVLLIVFLVVWALDSFFLHISTFLSEYIPLAARLLVSAVVLVLGVWLAKGGHIVVEDDERPSTVVSSGAFGYVRHPLYLGSILFYLALTIATASIISLGLFVIVFLFYNYIASYEEKLLVDRFGDDYRSYMETAGKWLPKFGRV
jgi:protein-S-isoprenylcysteine O-methyltransferase Ste14